MLLRTAVARVKYGSGTQCRGGIPRERNPHHPHPHSPESCNGLGAELKSELIFASAGCTGRFDLSTSMLAGSVRPYKPAPAQARAMCRSGVRLRSDVTTTSDQVSTVSYTQFLCSFMHKPGPCVDDTNKKLASNTPKTLFIAIINMKTRRASIEGPLVCSSMNRVCVCLTRLQSCDHGECRRNETLSLMQLGEMAI